MSFFLTDLKGKVIELDKPELLIGRDRACDIVISLPGVSMLHASLKIEGDQARIDDIASLNGTFINGRRISKHLLEDDDTIGIDEEKLTFHVRSKLKQTDPTLVRANIRPAQKQHMSAQYHTSQNKIEGRWAVGLGSKEAGTVMVPRNEINQILAKAESKNSADVDVMLFVSNGSYQGLTFRLLIDDRNVWEIGKGSHCDVIIAHPSVSESHAKLAYTNKKWRIVDQLSLNGIFINGSKVREAFIEPGTEFNIGPVECKLIQVSGAKPDGAIRRWLSRWSASD